MMPNSRCQQRQNPRGYLSEIQCSKAEPRCAWGGSQSERCVGGGGRGGGVRPQTCPRTRNINSCVSGKRHVDTSVTSTKLNYFYGILDTLTTVDSSFRRLRDLHYCAPRHHGGRRGTCGSRRHGSGECEFENLDLSVQNLLNDVLCLKQELELHISASQLQPTMVPGRQRTPLSGNKNPVVNVLESKLCDLIKRIDEFKWVLNFEPSSSRDCRSSILKLNTRVYTDNHAEPVFSKRIPVRQSTARNTSVCRGNRKCRSTHETGWAANATSCRCSQDTVGLPLRNSRTAEDNKAVRTTSTFTNVRRVEGNRPRVGGSFEHKQARSAHHIFCNNTNSKNKLKYTSLGESFLNPDQIYPPITSKEQLSSILSKECRGYGAKEGIMRGKVEEKLSPPLMYSKCPVFTESHSKNDGEALNKISRRKGCQTVKTPKGQRKCEKSQTNHACNEETKKPKNKPNRIRTGWSQDNRKKRENLPSSSSTRIIKRHISKSPHRGHSDRVLVGEKGFGIYYTKNEKSLRNRSKKSPTNKRKNRSNKRAPKSISSKGSIKSTKSHQPRKNKASGNKKRNRSYVRKPKSTSSRFSVNSSRSHRPKRIRKKGSRNKKRNRSYVRKPKRASSRFSINSSRPKSRQPRRYKLQIPTEYGATGYMPTEQTFNFSRDYCKVPQDQICIPVQIRKGDNQCFQTRCNPVVGACDIGYRYSCHGGENPIYIETPFYECYLDEYDKITSTPPMCGLPQEVRPLQSLFEAIPTQTASYELGSDVYFSDEYISHESVQQGYISDRYVYDESTYEEYVPIDTYICPTRKRYICREGNLIEIRSNENVVGETICYDICPEREEETIEETRLYSFESSTSTEAMQTYSKRQLSQEEMTSLESVASTKTLHIERRRRRRSHKKQTLREEVKKPPVYIYVNKRPRSKRHRKYVRVGKFVEGSNERVVEYISPPSPEPPPPPPPPTEPGVVPPPPECVPPRPRDTHSRGTSMELIPTLAKRTSTSGLVKLIRAVGTNTQTVHLIERGVNPIPQQVDAPRPPVFRAMKSEFTNTETIDKHNIGTDSIPVEPKPAMKNEATDALLLVSLKNKATNTVPEKKKEVSNAGTSPEPMKRVDYFDRGTDPLYHLMQRNKQTLTTPVTFQNETVRKPTTTTEGTDPVRIRTQEVGTNYEQITTKERGIDPIKINMTDQSEQFDTVVEKPVLKTDYTETDVHPAAAKGTQTDFVQEIPKKTPISDKETQTRKDVKPPPDTEVKRSPSILRIPKREEYLPPVQETIESPLPTRPPALPPSPSIVSPPSLPRKSTPPQPKRQPPAVSFTDSSPASLYRTPPSLSTYSPPPTLYEPPQKPPDIPADSESSELSIDLIFEKCHEDVYRRRSRGCDGFRRLNESGNPRNIVVCEKRRSNTVRITDKPDNGDMTGSTMNGDGNTDTGGEFSLKVRHVPLSPSKEPNSSREGKKHRSSAGEGNRNQTKLSLQCGLDINTPVIEAHAPPRKTASNKPKVSLTVSNGSNQSLRPLDWWQIADEVREDKCKI